MLQVLYKHNRLKRRLDGASREQQQTLRFMLAVTAGAEADTSPDSIDYIRKVTCNGLNGHKSVLGTTFGEAQNVLAFMQQYLQGLVAGV